MIFSLFLSFIFIYPSFYPAVGMSVFKEIPSIYIMERHDYCPEEFVYETEYPAVTELTYINISLYGR